MREGKEGDRAELYESSLAVVNDVGEHTFAGGVNVIIRIASGCYRVRGLASASL